MNPFALSLPALLRFCTSTMISSAPASSSRSGPFMELMWLARVGAEMLGECLGSGLAVGVVTAQPSFLGMASRLM